MTLQLDAVAARLPAVVAGYRERLRATAEAEAAATEAVGRWAADPDGVNAAIVQAMEGVPRPFALATEEPPDATFPAPPFEPATVVGVDGSSIEPDRFAAAPCYVVNSGWAVLPYHVEGAATLGSSSVVGPTGDHDRDLLEGGTRLLRDVRELEQGARLGSERIEHGPVVLLLDGTLIPWDLDSQQVPWTVRKVMRERTTEALSRLGICGPRLSVGAYISSSRAGEVVASVGVLAGPGQADWPLADAWLFGPRLVDGARSALFASMSTVAPMRDEVRFFYLRAGEDVARVELPQWAASPERVARLHGAIVDQCRRNGGYPRCLQEAHEQAVISAGDREQFSRLLDAEAARHGLHATVNGKQTSKRRRAV